MSHDQLPLFYRDPRPISSIDHGSWRIVPRNAGFAGETPYVPILLGEFAACARDYPIVFASPDASPIAVLGLEDNNLFVSDGAWSDGTYVPAYVRRYPFGFIPVGEERFLLAIDAASDSVIQEGDAGAPLFENGEPSEQTRQALAFCEAFHDEAAATLAFAAALKAQDLLVDRRADATLPDGRQLGVQGFQVVDAEKFAALPEAVIVEWHRRGWLGLVHHHFASLEQFRGLLNRQSDRLLATADQPEMQGTDA